VDIEDFPYHVRKREKERKRKASISFFLLYVLSFLLSFLFSISALSPRGDRTSRGIVPVLPAE
jgi:hypothetical protein